jgi:formylglycine-generating enzyme required for sulfatase activity
MHGNVDEWTETVMVDLEEGIATPRFFDRITYGGAFDAHARGRSIVQVNFVGIGPKYEIHTRGFRCAKTLPSAP